MFKAIIITLIGAGVIGTGAQTFTPEKLEISAGMMVLEIGSDGLNMNVSDSSEFGVTLTTKGARNFMIRL